MLIRIVAAIKPIAFNRPASRGKQRYDPPRYKRFKHDLKWYARSEMRGRKPFEGALHASLHIFKKNKGLTTKSYGDVDNFCKAVFDALNGVCFEDDAQIVSLRATKGYADEDFLVVELSEADVSCET